MQLDLYQVDAFTDKVFGGNPAAVCPLKQWLPDATLQKIALENNLSETAFFIPEGDNFHLRWFTPTTEIDLCGHATLASAYCLFEKLGFKKDIIYFNSRSGTLSVQKVQTGYTLNFPIWKSSTLYTPSEIESIIGLKVLEVYQSTKTFAVVENESDIKNFTPDIAKIKTLTKTKGLVITAKGTAETDFVSRLFAPQIGIDEDPVTGAIHCFLTPYWASILNKTKMQAKQHSARGGDLFCELKDDRVEITGNAVLYMQGKIYI